MTPPTALDLLSTLAPRPPRRPVAPVAEDRPRAASWCERCGAPRNLGRRDCPGCALLAESRERIVTYLARHGMPPGGPVELARLTAVPLRAVGAMIAEGARRDGRQSIVRTAT